MSFGFAACMLLTNRKFGSSSPLASASGKSFWCCCMLMIRHSLGTARNILSKDPASTTGYSTILVTSSTSSALLPRSQRTPSPMGPRRGAPAQPRAGHHFFSMQQDRAMPRTHELRLARAPAHGLGHRQLFQRRLHDRRQVILERLALLFGAVHEVCALLADLAFEFMDIDTARLGETEQRRGRLAAGIQRACERRAPALDPAAGLFWAAGWKQPA